MSDSDCAEREDKDLVLSGKLFLLVEHFREGRLAQNRMNWIDVAEPLSYALRHQIP